MGNQESVAVRQIDLRSQLFLKPAFLSDICIRVSDKGNCHCHALARYAGSQTSFMTKPALMFLRANQRAPTIGEVIVALALRKTAPASSRLSAATSIAKARSYYEVR